MIARIRPLAAVTALCGLLPVGALLAWSYGLGSFRAWFLAVGVPPLLALVVIGARGGRDDPRFRLAFAAGTIGGLLGAIGYDLFRVPFAMAGLRVFAPIESYGVLILGADTSGPLTHFTGWAFHFLNGIGFGIAYAMVALGRNRWWAVGWAMVLETVTIVTPFAATYGLAGKPHLIAIAYAAHVAYGLPLGSVTQSAPRARRAPLTVGLAGALVLALVAVLAVWHRPFHVPDAGARATVTDGRLRPEWLRVAPGGCATVRNADAVPYAIPVADGAPSVGPGETARVCFSKPGVHRLRLTDEPYSGGFVIVDETA
jgi:hypothetical protein